MKAKWAEMDREEAAESFKEAKQIMEDQLLFSYQKRQGMGVEKEANKK